MQEDWKSRLLGTLTEDEQQEVRKNAEACEAERGKMRQTFRIELDKRQKGKTATIVSGFCGSDDELKSLCRTLKTSCGSGGSFRDGEILIQGDFRQKIADLLNAEGHKTNII